MFVWGVGIFRVWFVVPWQKGYLSDDDISAVKEKKRKSKIVWNTVPTGDTVTQHTLWPVFFFDFFYFYLAVLFLFWLEGTSRGNWNVKTKKKSGICRRANTCFIMRWKTTNKPKKTIRKTKGKCQKERPLAGMRCFTVSLCVCRVINGLPTGLAATNNCACVQ